MKTLLLKGLKGNRVWCLGKYRGNVDPVMILREKDLARVWKEVHDRPDGHAGREPTLERFCTRYWFSGCQTWIRKKVQNCLNCHEKDAQLAHKGLAPLRAYTPEDAPWMRLHFDLTEGFYDVSYHFTSIPVFY